MRSIVAPTVAPAVGMPNPMAVASNLSVPGPVDELRLFGITA